jgi:hypothetical protein
MTNPPSAQELKRPNLPLKCPNLPLKEMRLPQGRHFDQEIIVYCVRWYLTFKLSSRDLVQMMAERGILLRSYDDLAVGAALRA